MKAVKTREGSEGRRRDESDTGGEACGQLVTLGSRRLRPYTCVLSTSSSVTALRRNLILRPASRLDAFSAYPIPTRIPGGAPGGTAGRPEVGRARSSRTSARAAQIDMSSWEGSACYPRSTFYPLSDGPSMRNRRITMPWFPTCSACLPPSQAPLCHCTPRPVTDRPEGTFGSLRYAFGGDHPSQTARQAVSPNKGLAPGHQKGRISTAAPPELASRHHCLRPILHIGCPSAALRCSKGSRGLFSLHHSCRSELTRQGISLP